MISLIVQRFSRAGPRGRGREWATLGVHPLSWLLSNNRLEKVPVVNVPHTSSNRLLLSNQDKGCTPSVAHSLPLPLGPALLNLSSSTWCYVETLYISAKLPILVEPRFFCILIPLQTRPELVPFFSNASSVAILNFKMAAIFGLFWAVFVPKSYKVIYFLMIVTTYMIVKIH